nr:hypothetical protein GCM10020093_062780 [Planobispora longispora]
MGGGALMTPMMMLFFNVPPLAAVSSDLVASAVMKPVGGAVHMRRGTVNLRLVGWLCAGSVPAAFCGVLLIRAFGEGSRSSRRSSTPSAWPCCWPWRAWSPRPTSPGTKGPPRRTSRRSSSARFRPYWSV